MSIWKNKNGYFSPPHTPTDTVAAISTPPGPGGVGMVRISGPNALAVGKMIFTPLGGWSSFPPESRSALVGHVHEPWESGSSPGKRPEDRIDQAVWVMFQAPKSYTGEDTVEVTAHGGALVMRSILHAACGGGARLAEPGEFTKKAYLNGRMDLSQVEAVASLIYASTEEARRVMLRQLEGALGRTASTIRTKLLEGKVLIEGAIDFPEDIEELDMRQLEVLLKDSLQVTESLLATARTGVALTDGMAVVIIGTPNVGKSSLLNVLVEEEKAIVHEIAGTTRDYIEGRIDIQGIPMRVIDTAGIRDGAGDIEVEGITRTRKMMEVADMAIVVLDSSRDMGKGDLALLRETIDMSRVIVANKSDLEQRALNLTEDVVKVSAKTGHGIDELKKRIYDAYIGAGPEPGATDAVITSLRQEAALKGVESACGRAVIAMEKGTIEPELIAVDVDEALMKIGELTGEVTADEVLNSIFERFCIGK